MLNFTPSFPSHRSPPPGMVQGDEEMRLVSVHNSSSLPSLPPHTFLPSWVFPLGCRSCKDLPVVWCREIPAPPWSLPGAGCKGISALASGPPPPLWPWCSLCCSSLCSLFHSVLWVFCPFLNTFSPSHHHLGWGAQPCPAVGGFEPAGAICVQHGAASASPHRVPCSPHCWQFCQYANLQPRVGTVWLFN